MIEIFPDLMHGGHKLDSNEALVLDAVDALATQRSLNTLLETRRALTELAGSFMIKRVIGVRLKEQEDEAINDVANIKDRLPVSTKDVKAHVSLSVDVRVVNWRIAVSNRRLVRVFSRVRDRKVVFSAMPDGLALVLEVNV